MSAFGINKVGHFVRALTGKDIKARGRAANKCGKIRNIQRPACESLPMAGFHTLNVKCYGFSHTYLLHDRTFVSQPGLKLFETWFDQLILRALRPRKIN
jgi:hypothetical protein